MVDMTTAFDPQTPPTDGAVTLRQLLSALDSAVVELVDAPAGDEVSLASASLVDSSDLSVEIESQLPMADLYLHVGVDTAEAVSWFGDVGLRALGHRPRAVMSKGTTDAVRAAAADAGVALVTVHPKARWDHVFPLVRRVLDSPRTTRAGAEDPDLLATDTDLFGLAQMVARSAGGMVSIEDAYSHVLAYSASDESADELRTLSILGREGPRDYLRALQEWGVFDRLRESDEVIDVPAHTELGTKRRLVVSIRQQSDVGHPVRVLGSIWVQQGNEPFAPDAADVLRGAAAMAARVISRHADVPSAEALLIQRLFGARGGGVDVPTAASALNLPTTGQAAVVGFAVHRSDRPVPTSVGGLLRLHASSFSRDSVVTIIGGRAYVLLPNYTSVKLVATWTRHMVDQFEEKRSAALRAAISAPVSGLEHVANARSEVDRVLDSTAATYPEGKVTTLAESRTAVLLGEIVDVVSQHPELRDPRLNALVDYDAKHSSNLLDSAETFLACFGDVRTAADKLVVHPNTLRYRIRRVEEIVGLDLQVSADRLLLELQIILHRRRDVA